MGILKTMVSPATAAATVPRSEPAPKSCVLLTKRIAAWLETELGMPAVATLNTVSGDLAEAIDFHKAIIAEGGKALVGYDTAKALANVVLLSEIPTTYDKSEQRQVNAGNLLLRGVPGVGKTFFGVILAAISNAKFARIQGRADLQPTEVVGFQMINPSTGALVTEFGPLASAAASPSTSTGSGGSGVPMRRASTRPRSM